MQTIPQTILDQFISNLEKRISSKEWDDCTRCIIAYVVSEGFIKPSKIRAYMVMKELYPKALRECENRTQAIKKVARQLSISDSQVLNIISNNTRY